MEILTESILVFATNIKSESDKQKISKILDNHSEIQQWNIDQEDIDCVLRIISDTLSERQLIDLLDHLNFKCSSLE